ncbi:hypothetical protein EYZ11_004982 [Aspergillus tanneri]|uniref:Uncharacterized protein n=1 Tax=Aspergillus tanneri TaxID=1220188 RepID=A0A4S3JLH3_9EURO|nr:hypothetical protein EYZ11_004982 [Aspergillus tanneri]
MSVTVLTLKAAGEYSVLLNQRVFLIRRMHSREYFDSV